MHALPRSLSPGRLRTERQYPMAEPIPRKNPRFSPDSSRICLGRFCPRRPRPIDSLREIDSSRRIRGAEFFLCASAPLREIHSLLHLHLHLLHLQRIFDCPFQHRRAFRFAQRRSRPIHIIAAISRPRCLRTSTPVVIPSVISLGSIIFISFRSTEKIVSTKRRRVKP
jgi:hypothetical protein